MIQLIFVVALIGSLPTALSHHGSDHIFLTEDRITLQAGDVYGRQIQLNDTYDITAYSFGTDVYIVTFDGNLTLNLAHFPSGTYEGMDQDVKRYQRNVTLNPEDYPDAYRRAIDATVSEEEVLSVPMHRFGLVDLDGEPMRDRDEAWKVFFFNITVTGVGNVTLYYSTNGIHLPTLDDTRAPIPMQSIFMGLLVVVLGKHTRRRPS